MRIRLVYFEPEEWWKKLIYAIDHARLQFFILIVIIPGKEHKLHYWIMMDYDKHIETRMEETDWSQSIYTCLEAKGQIGMSRSAVIHNLASMTTTLALRWAGQLKETCITWFLHGKRLAMSRYWSDTRKLQVGPRKRLSTEAYVG
jgi:hypothetical protein